MAEYGDTVAGYQDNFSSATMNTNWVPKGGSGSGGYIQENGVLKVFANQGDPNHLLYMAPGYSNDVQEVLARIRIVAFQQNDACRGGVGVCVGTNVTSGATNFTGMNLNFRNYTNESPVRHVRLLDDLRAWGPTVFTNAWQNNTWYWLRLRQQAKMDGTNSVFAKVWLADWATPEPTNWQLVWADSALEYTEAHGLCRSDRSQQRCRRPIRGELCPDQGRRIAQHHAYCRRHHPGHAGTVLPQSRGDLDVQQLGGHRCQRQLVRCRLFGGSPDSGRPLDQRGQHHQ